MSETIQKPIACRNAFCGGICNRLEAEHYGNNPKKCPHYVWNQAIYDKANKDKIYQQGIADERERIVRELEEAKKLAENTYMNFEMIVDKGRIYGLERAIEIVKGENV